MPENVGIEFESIQERYIELIHLDFRANITHIIRLYLPNHTVNFQDRGKFDKYLISWQFLRQNWRQCGDANVI